jgi:hypothetical protein
VNPGYALARGDRRAIIGPLTPVTSGLSRALADSPLRRSGHVTGPDGTASQADRSRIRAFLSQRRRARCWVPVEPKPRRAAQGVAVDSPVARSRDYGDDSQPASLIIVCPIGRPRAPVVGYLDPYVVARVELRSHSECPGGAAGPAVQNGVGRQFGGQQDQLIQDRTIAGNPRQVGTDMLRR